MAVRGTAGVRVSVGYPVFRTLLLDVRAAGVAFHIFVRRESGRRTRIGVCVASGVVSVLRGSWLRRLRPLAPLLGALVPVEEGFVFLRRFAFGLVQYPVGRPGSDSGVEIAMGCQYCLLLCPC